LATLKADVNTALHGNIPLRNKVTSALEKAPPTPSELVRQVDTVLDGNRPLRDKVKQALTGDDAVGRLKRIVGPGSPGMKRLGLIFEWALHRATVLMGDINAALDKGAAGQNDYELARGNYIKFLRDLDDHEPERKGRKLEVKVKDQPSGYGRSLKWACIDPVIFGGRIVGARVIIHWNPHSSSNGIPIQHP
jgi:hypothetical protein